jgi:hypothetical protein
VTELPEAREERSQVYADRLHAVALV